MGTKDKLNLEKAAIVEGIDHAGDLASRFRTKFEVLCKSNLPNKDLQWLQMVAAATGLAATNKQFHALERAIEDLSRSFGRHYRGEQYLQQLTTLREAVIALDLGSWDRHDPERSRLQDRFKQIQYDALVTGNPLLGSKKVIFVKRRTYTPGWYYAEFMTADSLFDKATNKAQGGLYVL